MNSGFLALIKPPGMTSHDAVQFIRKRYGTRDVGHAGTLDPAAAGVLVVAVGSALKLLQFLERADKEYYGEIAFGRSSTTGDAEGETVEWGDPSALEAGAVRRAAASLTGPIMQVPPVFSAIKVSGRPAYEKARRGETVELAARPVRVYRFDILDFAVASGGNDGSPAAFARFRVGCSKGTYVRVLAEDLGKKVGVPAHLKFLLRSAAGPFGLGTAVTVEQLEAGENDPASLLLAPLEAVTGWPRQTLTAAGMDHIRHGRPVALQPAAGTGTGAGHVALLDPEGGLAAVGRVDAAAGLVRPVKVLAPAAQ